MYAFRILDVRAQSAYVHEVMLDSNDPEAVHSMMHFIAREYAEAHPNDELEPNCEADCVTLFIASEPVFEIVAHKIKAVAKDVPKANFRKVFAKILEDIVSDHDMLNQAEMFYNDIKADPKAPPEAAAMIRDMIDTAKASVNEVPPNVTKH